MSQESQALEEDELSLSLLPQPPFRDCQAFFPGPNP